MMKDEKVSITILTAGPPKEGVCRRKEAKSYAVGISHRIYQRSKSAAPFSSPTSKTALIFS